MATSAHGKPATGYPLPQSIPAVIAPYYNSSPPRRFTSSFLCRFLAGIAAVFIVIALIAIIKWVILKPKLPVFNVVSGSVVSLSAIGSELSAQWEIKLIAKNPNHKLKLYYDSFSAVVFYVGNQLATTSYPPLLQQTRSENTVNVKLAVADEFIGEEACHCEGQGAWVCSIWS